MISTDLPLLYPDWDAPKNVLAYTSTRRGGFSHESFAELNMGDHVGDLASIVAKNRNLLPFSDQTQWMNQIHGNQVVAIGSVSGKAISCDGLLSKKSHQFCAVMTADCLPILITSRAGDEVAALHAGWKGLANGVIKNGVEQFSAEPSELMAWIGPAICAKCYEVDQSVKQHFQQYNDAFKLKSNKRFDFDLNLVAVMQLNQLGVANVSLSNLCTYCDEERFFSHRRTTHQNKTTCGRQVSVIGFL